MKEVARSSACPPCRVVVTGAAGGVGALCARELAARGAALALADIDKAMVRRLGQDIGAEGFCVDVLSEVSVSKFVSRLPESLRSADMLINAAGKGYVRALGMMRVTRAFADMVGDRQAVVVNIAPTAAKRGEPFEYAGSIIAFQKLSEGLAQALNKPNLRILTIETLEGEDQVADLIRHLCAGNDNAFPGDERPAFRA